MPDLSGFSIEELKALAGNAAENQWGHLSEEELRQIAGRPSLSGKELGADILKSGGIGVAKAGTGTLGLPGDIEAAGRAGINYMWPNQSKEPPKGYVGKVPPASTYQNYLPTSQDIQHKVEEKTGPFYEPKSYPGVAAERVGEFLPNMAFGEGGLASRAVRNVAAPAAGSLMGEAAAPHFGLPPQAGALVGSGIGSALPVRAMEAVTPHPQTDEVRRAAHTLQNEGVTSLTAGMRTNNPQLRYIESQVGGERIREQSRDALGQYTRAAMRRAGENTDRADTDAVNDMFAHIGGRFDTLASRYNLPASAHIGQNLANEYFNYSQRVPASQQAPIAQNIIRDVGDMFVQHNGQLPGDVYQSLRSRLAREARASTRDPELRSLLTGYQNVLDDAMEQHIGTINPQDQGAWRQVRRQYANALVIERAVTGGGQNAAFGLITPQALRTATTQVAGRHEYANGNHEMSDLVHAGNALMLEPPNSGTASRLAAEGHGGGGPLTGLAGAWAAGHLGGQDALTEGAGYVAGRLLGNVPNRVKASNLGQGYYGNQILATPLMREYDRTRTTPEMLAKALTNVRLGLGKPKEEEGNDSK